MLKDDRYDKYDEDVISRRRKSNTDNNNNFGKIEEENKTTVQKVFEIIGSIIGIGLLGSFLVFVYNHPEGIPILLFFAIVACYVDEFIR